ncbi:hypothetical protein LPJ79_004348 [Coemansia sp. RSA 1821]|nr:hypothetical protein LPJ79_004348 [Coemansia sp. RSA 1821]KAJ2672315.1 hypothetical protein IWW42_002865 [Coemansia sp. RSA 1085]
MSSYKRKAPWDRNNKYWCDYCRIYVYDNRTSRNQHETGAKHKNNVQKYLRKMGKDADAKEQAEKQLNSQLAKIEQAAAKSFQRDMGTTHIPPVAKPASKPAPAPANPAPANPAPAYHKPVQSEGEIPVQSNRPANMGIIGEWEVVEDPAEKAKVPIAPHDDPSSSTTELRGEELLDEEDQPQQMAEFEITEKTAQVSSTDGSEGAPVFKKRRTPANRSTRKKH